MSEEIHRILSLDDRGVSEARNAPAKLFRSILCELHIDRLTWDRLMRNFLTDPRSGIPNNPTKRSSERSNLNRALSKETVTWKMFRKALRVLNPANVEYQLDLVWEKDYVFPNASPHTLRYTPFSRENELGSMFQRLVRDLGITPQIWSRLMERWLDSPASRIRGDNPPDRSTERGNIKKALINKKDLTWPTFCRGLAILGVKEATLTVTLEWPRKTTQHSHHFSTGLGTKE
jgi:hypothetical protein